MDAAAAIGLYIIISIILSLIFNLFFYRLVFKKPTRRKANLFTWLSSLGVMLVINGALLFLFMTGVDVSSVGGGIGFGLLMPFIIAPIFWFLPTTVFVIIRAIVIAITKRERDVMTEEVEVAELISTQNGQTLN